MISLRATTSGFTVIEILIVVVILAIVAMVAIPMMASAGSMQIRSASDMIAADIEYAKSMAISRQQNYSVVFDGSNDSYKVCNASGTVIPHPVKKGFNYVVDFQNDSRLNKVDIVSSNLTITFDSLGSPSNGASITLGLQGQPDGATITITVEPVTGFISISE